MDSKLEQVRQRAWTGQRAPGHVESYPSMLSDEERRMLRWLAAEYYSGSGCVCDLGSFLGGSTVALADGLRAAGHTGRRIHSYDRHRIRPEAWRKWGLQDRYPFPEDGYFLPVMRDLLGDLAGLVEFHSGDFPQSSPPDEPIEILFVDIVKAKKTSDHVISEFFPRLIPNRSIVIQQDYFHSWPFFDVYVMEVLQEYFQPLASAENSALFLNTRPIETGALGQALSARMTLPALRAALRAAGDRWPPGPRRAAILGMLESLEGLDAVPGTHAEFLRARARARPEAAGTAGVWGKLRRVLGRAAP
jgi:hypothetical protein